MGPKHLLFVEDVYYNQVLIESLLIDWGYTVSIVKNGKEALSILEKERFDLIVLDIMLPVMDGYTFLDEKRKVGNPTPVIVLSARNDPKSILKALELGAIDYVCKPFNSFDLRNKIHIFFKEQQEGKK
jgi:CheY-like chemotaxis protein